MNMLGLLFLSFFFQLPFTPAMDRQGTLKADARAWYDVTTHIFAQSMIEKFLD